MMKISVIIYIFFSLMVYLVVSLLYNTYLGSNAFLKLSLNGDI